MSSPMGLAFPPRSEPGDGMALMRALYAGAWAGAPKGLRIGPMTMVSTPEGAADLMRRPEDFAKAYDVLSELGRSRFDRDGTDWAARRDLTQPLYNAAARSARAPQVAAAYARRLGALAPGPARGLERALMAGAGDVFASAFGAATDGARLADWLLATRGAVRRAQRAYLLGTGAQDADALRADVRALRAGAAEIVGADPALGAHLEGMRAAMRRAGTGLPFDALEEMYFAFIAGTEALVAACLWAVSMLGRLPDAQEAVAAEAATDGAGSARLGLFVQETLRYYPPIPILPRRAAREGATIRGRGTRAGAVYALDVVGLHHDPRLWEAPWEFRPERAEFRDGTHDRWAYLPFAAGPRICGGVALARLEMRIALAELLRRFRVRAPEGPPAFEFALALRPREAARLTLAPRGA